MKILGQGHKSIVVTDTPGGVKKYYLTEAEALKEQAQLEFLEDLQGQGVDLGCTFPRLLEAVGKGRWEIGGKTYIYCNRLERIPGIDTIQAMPAFTERELKVLGNDLGAMIATMHASSKPYADQWKRAFWGHDDLLRHIFEDKVGDVIRDEPDLSVRQRVDYAARYLMKRRELLAGENTLSHTDLNLPNVLTDDDGHVNGLVDWGGFGLTNPSLSLYQLAARSVWADVKRQYESMGGRIREDVVYAAAAIHLAWVPIICARLDLEVEEDSTREYFEKMYEKFDQVRDKR